MPVMGPRGPGQHDEVFLQTTGFRYFYGPAVFIDAGGPAHLCKRRRGNQFAIGGIKDVEESVFGCLHDHATVGTVRAQGQVRKHHGLGRRVVPGVPGRGLVMPAVGAGIGVHGDYRSQKQVVAVTVRVSDLGIPGRAIAHAQ